MMKQYLFNSQKKGGFSYLGHPCSRYVYNRVWLDFEYPPITEETQKIFDYGHDAEPFLASWIEHKHGYKLYSDKELLDLGYELRAHDPEDPKQVYIKPEALGGLWSGQADGIALSPEGERVLVEYKTTSLKKLKEIISVQTWNIQYYYQVQLYMHFLGLKKCFFVVAVRYDKDGVQEPKSSKDVHTETIEYKESYAISMIKRALLIAKGKEQPQIADGFKCCFCPFKQECGR